MNFHKLASIKRHPWRTIGIVIAVLFLGAVFYVTRPDTLLPHKRIVLHAPYDLANPVVSLLPMGEKIYHLNAPLGHPGIDFQWASPNANVLASADGKITSIGLVFDKWNKWEMDIESWPYVVRYKEMETYNTALKVGQHVKVGDFLGHPANPKLHNEVGAYQIHWEFASLSLLRDRFCPMTYFDKSSAASVQAVWDRTNWQYKSQYPNVCSGGYANKSD